MTEQVRSRSRRDWQHSMTKNQRKDTLDFLRHPLTLLVVGFLLTGILGTIFSQWINQQQRKAQEEAARQEKELEDARVAEDSRKRAVQNLSIYI
jgi:uncharacterized protein HemX